MATEIERKFLVTGDDWRGRSRGIRYRQGYLCADEHRSVRVRVAGETGYLTVKGAVAPVESGCLSRYEFEYPVPLADAEQMLATLCQGPLIEKTRYRIEVSGLIWEVDEFAGANQGLVLAEVELDSEDQHVSLPSWVGPEVSGDPRYLNSSLARHPWSDWPENR